MPEPINVGDVVRVLPPFDAAFPGTYVVESINPDTGAYQIAEGRDFDPQYLEVVE